MADQGVSGGAGAAVYDLQGNTVEGTASGGMGGGTVEVSMKDYVDAQDERTRAENAAVFSDVMAELRIIRETAASWRSVWGAAAAVTVALTGMLLGVLTFGGDRFDGGMAARGLVNPIIEDQKKRDAAQDRKLGQILTVVEQIRDEPKGSP